MTTVTTTTRNHPIESARRFQILVEAVVDCGIYMLDPQGIVATWNVGAERIKGYRADEIIGQSFSRFFTPEDQRLGKPGIVLETARRTGRSKPRHARVSTRPKAGASARTGRGSGLTWSSTRCATNPAP